jgi:hypothetical protein
VAVGKAFAIGLSLKAVAQVFKLLAGTRKRIEQLFPGRGS